MPTPSTSRDPVDHDAFELTQEFLATMLGATRPKLSQVQATFQRAGFITFSRGRPTVLGREALKDRACDCHAIIAARLATLDPRD